MALSCRNFGQEDPFQQRKLFIVDGAPEGPSGESDRLTSETEAVKERMDKIKIPEVIGKMNQEMDRLLEEGTWDLSEVGNFERALESLEDIKSLGTDSPEFKDALKSFHEYFGSDLRLDIQEITKLQEAVVDGQRRAEERLILREAHSNRAKASIYLMGSNGERVKPGNEESIGPGSSWTVDFAGNKEAEKNVGLRNMLPDSVQHVTVTKRNGSKVEGYRHENGNYYQNPLKKEGYISVFNGYKIEVPGDAVAEVDETEIADTVEAEEKKVEEVRMSEATQEVLSAKMEVLKLDAGVRIERARAAAAERHRATLELALDLENGLDRGDKATLPDALQGKSEFTFSETLQHMDYGDQAMQGLDQLSQIGFKSGTMVEKDNEGNLRPLTEHEAFQKIRMKKLGRETVSFSELSRATYHMSPEQTLEKFKTLSQQIQIIEIADEIIAQEKDLWMQENGSLEGFDEVKVFRRIRDTLFAGPNGREMTIAFYGISDYVIGSKRGEKQKFSNQLNEMENFMVASYQVLDAVPKLKARERTTAAELTQNRELTEEQSNAEILINSIFDRNDQGPKVKRSVLRRIFKLDERGMTMNMDMYMENAKYKKELNLRMSGSAAFTQVLHGSLDVQGNQESVNGEKLINKLNELREHGVRASSFDSDTMNKVGNVEEYLAAPLTQDLLENPNSLSELDRTLITRGMMLDQGTQFIERRQQEIERIKENSLPMTGAAIDALAAEGAHTPDQLQDIANALNEHYLFTAGLMFNNWENMDTGETGTRVGLGLDVPIQLPHGVTLRAGLDQNSFNGRLEIHAGLGGVINTGERTRIGVNAGAQLSGTEARVGAGANFQIDLGKYKTGTFDTGAFAGISTEEKVFLGAVLSAGYTRNMEGVLVKKMAKLEEKERGNMDLAMQKYENDLSGMGLNEQQISEFKAELENFLGTMLQDRAIDSLKGLQFLGVGVALVVPPQNGLKPPVYLKLGIKGKKFIMYSKPETADMGEAAEIEMERAIAAQEGGELTMRPVHISGDLMVNASGKRSIAESFNAESLSDSKFEGINASLAPHGIELTQTAEGVRLDVSKTSGVVDVFASKDSGLETHVGSDGGVYLNMDAAQLNTLSVRRSDEYYPFRKNGFLQHTKIHLSNNIFDRGSAIESDSSEYIQFTEHAGATTQTVTRAEVVQTRKLEGVAGAFSSKEEMIEAGVTLEQILSDPVALGSARSAMDEALGNRPGPALTGADREHLDAMAKQIVKANKLSYRQLSTIETKKSSDAVDYEKILALVKGQFPDQELSDQEVNYLTNSMMVATLAKAPKGKEFAKHILNWNKQALARSLDAKGMSKPEAEKIAGKIMENYGKTVIDRLNAGEPIAQSEIQKGSIVHIQVGTMKVEGYREAFHDAGNSMQLVEAQLLDPNNLVDNFGLTEEEADKFIATVTEQLSPLPDNAEELFRSPLGLAVLDGAEFIFGPEKTLQLAAMVKDPALAGQAENAALYEEYQTMVTQLRETGSVVLENGLVLQTTREQSMGFYEKCNNFTLTMNEKLQIAAPEGAGTAVSQEVIQRMEGRPGIKFYGFGVAAVVGGTREREPEQPTEEFEGEKEPGGDVTPGQEETPPEQRAGDNEAPDAPV